MAFTDRRSARDRGAGMAGVVVVHAGLAAILLAGLAVGEFTPPEDEGLEGYTVTVPLPPPPPPEPRPERDPTPANSTIFTPPIPDPLPQEPDFIHTTTELPPISDDLGLKIVPPIKDFGPPVIPGIKPVVAVPRNDPSRWVTDDDYKGRWALENMSGTARFKLEIAANGKVSDCRITKSTGHEALDRATCQLIAKRARFKPAKDDQGNPAAGSYSSAIRWELPD